MTFGGSQHGGKLGHPDVKINTTEKYGAITVKKCAKNGRFCPNPPALPDINRLTWTETPDKTDHVLGGFCP